ncbi:MAG TPA: hypothetical protein VIL24_03280 [Clostridia bacterium]
MISIYLNDATGFEGGQARNLYFKNISSQKCYGLPVRIYISRNCSLGKVHLDNITYGNKTIAPESVNNSNVISINDANNNWSLSNLKINTLV